MFLPAFIVPSILGTLFKRSTQSVNDGKYSVSGIAIGRLLLRTHSLRLLNVARQSFA